MADIFTTATQARKDSRNNSVIHNEIRVIESKVIANIDSGVLYANVISSTTMTNSNVYYNVWNIASIIIYAREIHFFMFLKFM